MKTRWIVLSLAAAVLVTVGGLQAAKEESKEFKATCPVSGKAAKEASVVELRNGDKVYFCCDNCPKAFKANRAKFAVKVNQQLAETGQVVQIACPITGKATKEETAKEIGATTVAFCCKNCEGKFDKADEEGKVKLAFAKASFDKGFTRQTKCPVSGKPINPEVTVDYKDKKVYFCCPGCPPAFEKDPAKFEAKLPQLKKGRGGAADRAAG